MGAGSVSMRSKSTSRLRTIFPEKIEHPAITGGTFCGQETRVQQGYLLTPERGLHCLVCFLSLADRIADEDCASTVGEPIEVGMIRLGASASPAI
mgnify:CR=1 FL=1